GTMEFLAISSLLVIMAAWSIYTIVLNRRLVQSQNRYLQFFNDSPVALIVIDKKHRILKWNHAAEIIFGWKMDEVFNKDIFDFLVSSFDKEYILSVLQTALSAGASHSENYNVTSYRKEIFCEWHNRLLPGTKGDMLCMIQDITATKKALDELNNRSAALESAGDAILYTDGKGLIKFANRSFFLLNLGDPDDVYGTHIGTYLFKDQLTFNTLQLQFSTERTWKGTITKSSENGNKVLSVTITAIYNYHKRLISYIANLHDITQLSCHVDALTHRAYHDPLTGATNRAAMNDRLLHAIERADRSAQQIALFFLDLNDFKIVNDRYGHEAGDRLLFEVAKNLRECLRNSDTLSRYGGDEFVIIIEDIQGQEHIETIRTTIEAAIQKPIFIDMLTTLEIKASIGTAIYPKDAADAQTLIKAADTSMYAMKRKKDTPLTSKEKNLSEPLPIPYADSHNR
ncbi:MAG: diguanylate cyclase domain-containing protein, partial [Sulfuricurvum sp.]